MSQISENAKELISKIQTTSITKLRDGYTIPNEIYVDLTDVKTMRDVHAVCKALVESKLHVSSIKLGREATLADIEYISSLLLRSGRNIGEYYANEISRSERGQKFLLKGLDLSGCSINDEMLGVIIKALEIEYIARAKHSPLSLVSTLENLNLSNNKISPKMLSCMFSKMSKLSVDHMIEFGHASQSFFIDGYGGLKPFHSVPMRSLDISYNIEGSKEEMGLLKDSLCAFLGKNWTLTRLGIANMKMPGMQDVMAAVVIHNEKETLHSAIHYLDLRNNNLKPGVFASFNPNVDQRLDINLRGNVEMKGFKHDIINYITAPIPSITVSEVPDDVADGNDLPMPLSGNIEFF